uniref:Uncharacterized protein n=1 Tax=Ignisphaera aggregans TaxID=334771 RepID=A0A7C4FHW9_9CREN
MDQVLSIVLVLTFIAMALIASMVNYMRYESSYRRKKEELPFLNITNVFKHVKKGYAYSVDLGDSVVFIAVVEKDSKSLQLNVEPQEATSKIFK